MAARHQARKCRMEAVFNFLRGSRRDMTPRQDPCQESSSVRAFKEDSGYRVNSITTTNSFNYTGGRDSLSRTTACLG
jgi:hypothetical protein